MLQKALQALVLFLSEFVINHPRVVWSIVGVLCAVALLACVVSINLLIGG
uniref:Uncharacterized protein n=1 Tax=Dulem virus 194 TaxID=3145671 RepID=A0AAU8B9W0_9VIRU